MATKNQSENKGEKLVYLCPMRCEADKVYDHQGDCPVCNMNLVLVGESQPSCC